VGKSVQDCVTLMCELARILLALALLVLNVLLFVGSHWSGLCLEYSHSKCVDELCACACNDQ